MAYIIYCFYNHIPHRHLPFFFTFERRARRRAINIKVMAISRVCRVHRTPCTIPYTEQTPWLSRHRTGGHRHRQTRDTRRTANGNVTTTVMATRQHGKNKSLFELATNYELLHGGLLNSSRNTVIVKPIHLEKDLVFATLPI